MKNQIILLFLALAISACKTTSGPVGQASTEKHREFPEPSFAEFAQPTRQRDTLYLIDGDIMSRLTARIWELDTTKTKPEIVMVSRDNMICIKKRCNENK